MARAADFKRRIRDAKRALEQAAQQAGAGSRGTGESGLRNVNVANRANVVVAGNVASRGSKRGVSSRQKVRVRQNGGERYEEVDTTEVSLAD